jgi:hypothetical protein
MTITVDQRVGVDFGVPITGIPIKVEAGSNGKMVIQVKYKSPEQTTTDDSDKQMIPAP